MKLKIMEWNIRGSASLSWNNSYQIKKELADKIIEQNADVFVLTELIVSKGWDYLQQQLEDKQYIWFAENQTGKNGILIGVKKEIVDTDTLVEGIYSEEAISSLNEGCNFLKAVLPLKNKKTLTVIGFRMETELKSKTGLTPKSLKEQYDYERKIFDEILFPRVKEAGSIAVVCGDFNNARCLGNLNQKYNAEDYMGYDQINYNLNIIKDAFESAGFEMADRNKSGEPVMTHKNYKGYEYPEDHIFVKGLIKSEECTTVPVNDLSDHYIIWTVVELNE